MTPRRWRAALTSVAVAIASVSCSESTAVTIDVARLEVTPGTASVQTGASVPLTARAFDTDGNPIASPVLRWSSSDVSVATVATTGVVSTLAPGSVRIAVSSMGRSAVSNLTVVPRPVASIALSPAQATVIVGRTTRITATALDATGAPLAGRTITFTSSDASVATIRSDGTVTGIAPGSATIVATSEGRTAQAAVTVGLPPVQTVTVSPSRDTLVVNGTRPFTVQLRDANGALLADRPVTWTSSNTTVAIVSATGSVVALAPGTATITASSEGRTGTATLEVLERLPSAVTLTPGSVSLTVGRSVTLSVQITDAQGNVLIGRPVTFASEAPTVAAVSASGVVTAVTPGVARIVASSEGRSGLATITVTPVPVARVLVAPSAPSLITGEAVRLSAVTFAADDTPLTGRTVEWRSGAPNVATVSADGTVSAVAPGTAIVLATSEGVTATATVTVRVPPVLSVSVTPTAPAVDVGQSVQLTATTRGAGGETLTGRPVTWRSSNEQVAFVSSTGVVVGLRAGTATITATAEGVSASIIVTVR